MIDLDEPRLRRLVLEGGAPLVVEFHADWCPFGALLGPKLRRIEREFGPTWRVARFDVVGFEDLAVELGIDYVPALAVYTSGQRRAVWFGDPPITSVLKTIEALSNLGDRS